MITAGHIRYNEWSKRLAEHSECDSASFFSSYSLSKALENSPRFSPWSRYDSRNDFAGSFASDGDEFSFLWISIRLFRSTNFSELRLQTRCFYVSNIGTFVERPSQQVRPQLFHLLSTFFSSAFAFTSSSRNIFKVIATRRTRDSLSVQDEDDRRIVARETIAVTYTELVLRRSFRHSSTPTFHTRAFQSDPSCFAESVFFLPWSPWSVSQGGWNYRDADVTLRPRLAKRIDTFRLILDSRSAFPPIDQFSSASWRFHYRLSRLIRMRD